MPDPKRRPRILVTLDIGEEQRRGVPLATVHMKAAYARAIEGAGGLPILAAPTADRAVIGELAEIMDALVVTGGAFDIEPSRYGGSAISGARIDPPKPLRTSFETALLEIALARDLPLLGVCGGMQLLNVVLGGELIQDIGSEVPGAIEHEQATSPLEPAHAIEVLAATPLHRLVGTDRAFVNTTHHQAVSTLGRGLEAWAKSEDGVVEAIGKRGADLRIIGVQWHPELLDDRVSRRIYGALVEEASQRRPRG